MNSRICSTIPRIVFQLYGNAGDDRLFGGLGKDTLYGNDGDDKLFGNLRRDWLMSAGGVMGYEQQWQHNWFCLRDKCPFVAIFRQGE